MLLPSPQQDEGSAKGLFAVADELNRAVATRLSGALPALGATYIVASGMAVLSHPGGAGSIESRLALLAAVCSLGVWFLVRRDLIALRLMHLTAASICLMAVLHGLMSLRYGNPAGPAAVSPATVLFLVIAASGATLYSLRWHAVVVGVAMAGWVLAMLPVLDNSKMIYWLVVLAATALLSGINLRYRLWKFGKREAPAEGFDPEYFQRAVEGTQDGLWYWELKPDIFHFSPAWATLLGFDAGELSLHPNEWLDRVHPGYLGRLRSELAAHLYDGAPQFSNEHRIRRKDGTYIWVLARGTAIRNAEGEPVALAGSHGDITALIEAERRLLADAYSDPLTGLPNRSFLMGHLERSVEEKRYRGGVAPMFAVMFLDLDRFKHINDTMGHDVGDQLLKAVGGRLKNCSRPDDVVARFGGDEFVLLLRKLKDSEEAMQVGARIVKALATPFQLGDRTVQSGGSVGIALSRESFSDAEELLRFGDIAMYEAKRLRNGEVQLFHLGMLENSNAQGVLKSDLESALRNNQMVLHYQPFIHMATGRIAGAEALLRWQRSPEELLYPVDFLPVAEKCGLMHEIGEWGLRTACTENSAWRRAGVGPVRMAVNLSASQLRQPGFPEMVQRVLADTEMKPEWLELELTAAMLTRSMDVAPAALKSLTDSGIRASLGDFVSGSASLDCLRQIHFHTIKMDRSFVADIATDARAASVARGLITFAHGLDLSVVAEGVEKDDQFRFLSAEKCDQVQGYFTGRPIPGNEMLRLLRSRQNVLKASPAQATESDLSRLNASHATAGADATRWAVDRNARR